RGRDALLKRKDEPTRRRRVGLELTGKRIAREGASVRAGGKAVGVITSGTFSPTFNKVIAMAYVDPAHQARGTALDGDIRGKPVVASDEKGFGVIESVKAVSDLYAPVGGEVAEVNKAVADDPALVGADPYGKGWLIKIKIAPGTTLDHLLTPEQYEQQIASQGH